LRAVYHGDYEAGVWCGHAPVVEHWAPLGPLFPTVQTPGTYAMYVSKYGM